MNIQIKFVRLNIDIPYCCVFPAKDSVLHARGTYEKCYELVPTRKDVTIIMQANKKGMSTISCNIE